MVAVRCRGRTVVANQVVLEVEDVERGVGAERLGERDGALVADLVVLEVQLVQLVVAVKRLSQSFGGLVRAPAARGGEGKAA